MSIQKAPLIVDQILKNYGNHQVLKKISFSIESGEIFGLLGPNGAGKTTLISIISTLEKQDFGVVYLNGVDLKKDPYFAKQTLGVVPQELVSQAFFSVEEILHFQSGYFGILNNQKWIDYLIKKLELGPHKNKRAAHLSGGMKRRLMIAKALVHQPKLLLLDEPSAGVDVDLRKNLWDFVRELNEKGTTILLTTHYLEEAEELCNRIAVIDHGNILRIDETQKLIQDLTFREITLQMKTTVEHVVSPYLLKQEKNELTFKIPRKMSLHELFEQTKLSFSQLKDIQISEGTLEQAFRNILSDNNEK